jgi:hypothetical protein
MLSNAIQVKKMVSLDNSVINPRLVHIMVLVQMHVRVNAAFVQTHSAAVRGGGHGQEELPLLL